MKTPTISGGAQIIRNDWNFRKMPRECDAENPDGATLQSEESRDFEVDFVEITPETDLTPIAVIPFPEKS